MNLKQMLKTKLLPVTAGAVVVALAFVHRYNERYGATLILTSHYMEDVQRLCPRVIVIDKGKLVSDSSGTIKIMRADGPSVSATVTSSTRFYGIKPPKLVPGDRVLLVSGGGGNAVIVASRGPAPTASSATSSACRRSEGPKFRPRLPRPRSPAPRLPM